MNKSIYQQHKISFLRREEIDDELWNRVIASSEFETVYAYTWYLDACADRWGALVLPEYKFVMPVAFRRKFGFRYTYQPRFCQQLGIYSELKVDEVLSGCFLQALMKHFKFGDYAFNEGMRSGRQKGFEISDNINYTLYLGASYDQLKKGYKENCTRNVGKARKSGLEFTGEIRIKELVALKRQHDHIRLDDKHYQSLTAMYSGLEEAGKVKAYGVKYGSDVLAGAIFAFSKKRVHYLLSVSTDAGKELNAMFYVIDRIIQINSGKDLFLDFEGSNISGVARFFSGFGGKAQKYQRARFNNMAGKFVQIIKSVRPD